MNQVLPSSLNGAQAMDAGQWQARLELHLQRRRGGTRLVGASHEGPLYVQKPFYPEGPDCAHLYLLHPPGGIVSGDTLDVRVDIGRDASALFTTPGAARAYRARPDARRQYQRTHLRVSAGASIEWLPLETIVYDGAVAELETEVELARGSRCVLWEVTCLGLPASNAPFERGSFRQRYRVSLDGLPVFVDGFALNDGNRERMAGAGALRGEPVSGFILLGPFASLDDDCLQSLRDSVREPDKFSITRIDAFLVGRYLGDSAERARAQFVRWWERLRPLLLERDANSPRIWLT